MGVALGLIAIALVGAAGEPKANREDGQIRYTVRFLETEGMGWREAVFTRLTPVTRQGSATVWTAPGNVKPRLLKQALNKPGTRLVETPAIAAWSGAPVHFSIRNTRSLVTRVAWDGDDRPEEGKPETLRTGPVGTMTGRKMDQGILVQLVLEDTEVRAIHHMNVPRTGERHSQAAMAAPAMKPQSEPASGKATSMSIIIPNLSLFPIPGVHGKVVECPQNPTNSDCCTTAKDDVIQAHLETSAPVSACCAADASAASCTKADEGAVVSIEVPEIASQEIAGEWLIPKDGILLVSFGPHTVAGKDGKAVIRERLAILEAEGIDDGTVRKTTTAPARVAVPSMVLEPAPMPRPAGKPAGAENLPTTIPALPSRSIPQGVHADGTPAELPPLPADEVDDSSSSESDEPRPSPQTRKSRPKPKPAADSQMNRTSHGATSLLPAMPPVFLAANQTVGLQFLMPIKAVSLRLPFNRKLEIEIFGRIIRNPETVEASAELVAKPKDSKIQ